LQVADNRRAVVAWSAGLSAVAATLAGIVASRSAVGLWHNWGFICLLALTLLTSAILVAAGIPDLIGWLRERHPDIEREENEPPLLAGRWRYTADGFDVPAMLRLPQKSFSYPVHTGAADSQPAIARIGAFVACDPLDPHSPATPELRAGFLALLRGGAVAEVITEFTPVSGAAAWSPLAGNGRLTLEAFLARPGPGASPFAWAMLVLPGIQAPGYANARLGAELVLHIDLRAGGDGLDRASLSDWHRRLTAALAVPEALASFLSGRAGVATHSRPPAQFGIWVRAPQAMTELVDPGGLPALPGAWTSSEFSGWAFTDPRGTGRSTTACGLLRQLCEDTLHLDGYEDTIAALGDTAHGLRDGTGPGPASLEPASLEPASLEPASLEPASAAKGPAARNGGSTGLPKAPQRGWLTAKATISGRLVITVLAVILALGTMAGYLLWNSTAPPPRPAVRPYGTITSPYNGESNVHFNTTIPVTGTAHNIHSGHRLWLFLYVATADAGAGLYYPSNGGPVLRAGGQWSGAIYIGGTGHAGQRLTLWLADLGPVAVSKLGINVPGPSPGFAGLRYARDVTPLASVTFTTG
jgi:hypothetical protein